MLAARIELKNVTTASEVRITRGTFPMRQTPPPEEHHRMRQYGLLTLIVAAQSNVVGDGMP